MPLAVYALMAGAFGIGVTEFVIMGLLLEVSADLGVSISAAGLLISGYALGVVVGAPLLTAATSRWPRKNVLVGLMLIFTVGNLACALAPDYGLLMAALFGGETLAELRAALAEAEIATLGGLSPRVAPMGEIRALGGLLQRAGFAMPVADSLRFEVSYPDMLALMRDLRAMGESNLVVGRRRGMTGRAVLLRAAELYADRFARPGGRVTASFEVLFLHGWSPHASQPKALKPGSAAHRLADVLGTSELSAGEKVERS